MNIIANVDKNWAIGFKNKLLVSIPADMRFFRETTSKKVVVMGRKTLESFPNGRPLKNRVNIVMTSNPSFSVEGATIVHTIKELQEVLKQYDTKDVFVIGGESIYRQLLPFCDTAYITRTDHTFQADTYFPDLDKLEDWKLTEVGEEQTCFDLEFAFTKYERCQVKR